ncbi:MAG: ABC transporter ATP-binding protein [Fervidobacterium sp.]|uniref:ATP-binding cassette, subfamily B n=1 Tax=Fervidobacterium gondwanense DSM 13020 TaxID=1121883 RepID=A0A1M7SZA1_FERGO|nr:ABC transporter ATP-binding protein [Fervidobacterium gondwanense]SHN63778.1 ATP-binding cassette, subfamily B [Fervidobacterium gondwanense DSM 13020]
MEKVYGKSKKGYIDNLRMLNKFMKGSRVSYFVAIVSTALATFLSILTPLVIRFTLDNLIGRKEIDSQLVRRLVNLVGYEFLSRNIWIVGVFIVLLTLLNGLSSYLRGKYSSKAAEGFAERLKNALFEKIIKVPVEFHSKYSSGELIQRCTSDVETIRNFLANELVEVSRTIFLIIMVMYTMLRMDKVLTGIAVVTIPALIGVSYWFFKMVEKYFKMADEAEAEMTTVVQENITGIRVVKAFTLEREQTEKFQSKNLNFQRLDYKLYVLFARYWAVSDFIALVQIALVSIFGIFFTISGKITLGTFIAFTSYVGMFLWPVRQLGRILSNLSKMNVSLNRVGEILKHEDETSDEVSESEEIREWTFRGEIEFRNVSFKYGDNEVLRGVSFKIDAGETVGIFGPTGSGKSTLLNLLLKLYTNYEGEILIDGIELRNIPRKVLRENIGFVSQEPFLFSKQVDENVAITKETIDMEEVMYATTTASLHDDIETFPNKYKTIIGERGVTLSGGQRQRMAIARTIIREYPVLIFDDSMSAVDTETEYKIRLALRERTKGLTTIIVSHRIPSIKHADKIVVLENGIVTAIGKHEELIKIDGIYKKVWKIQSLIEDEYRS